MPQTPLLLVDNLHLSAFKKSIETPLLKGSTFTIHHNEIVAVVGESGSGKSLTALALMGLLPKPQLQITKGRIMFNGENLLQRSEKAYQKLRGNTISMIFQEPMSALNPSMRCGEQVGELLKRHTTLNAKAITEEVLDVFKKVKLPQPKRIYKAYPHEISGGQKQRVMIAMAIICKPQLLIADEPTTALDVTVQSEILKLLKDIQKSTKMSMLFISHDLALVADFADHVIVKYKGEIVEQANAGLIFKQPKHRYTKALINARPSGAKRLHRLPTISNFLSKTVTTNIITKDEREYQHRVMYKKPPLLEIKNIDKTYFRSSGWFTKAESFKAVDNVSFRVYPGETLGLVGESGCGKSTLGNVILQLDNATAGTILFKGDDITTLSKLALRHLRKHIQLIFQDPFASLNPRLQVGEAILEPMKVHGIGTDYNDRKLRVIDLLNKVGLLASDFYKYPHEFSGGQRQRIGIARTIALQPQLIVCDESVSALDISVQAQVLNLLNDLKDTFGFTYIFISHDLSVVRYMADQLLVMNAGKIEEAGEADQVFSHPKTSYTKTLINAIPKHL